MCRAIKMKVYKQSNKKKKKGKMKKKKKERKEGKRCTFKGSHQHNPFFEHIH